MACWKWILSLTFLLRFVLSGKFFWPKFKWNTCFENYCFLIFLFIPVGIHKWNEYYILFTLFWILLVYFFYFGYKTKIITINITNVTFRITDTQQPISIHLSQFNFACFLFSFYFILFTFFLIVLLNIYCIMYLVAFISICDFFVVVLFFVVDFVKCLFFLLLLLKSN